MWKTWKPEIITAIKITLIVAICAVLINWVRTPILFAAADRGLISHARANQLKGVSLIDSWEHGGWHKERELNGDGFENGYPSVIREYFTLDLETTKRLYDEGECIFIDAREVQYYEEGHIPGAINWPYNEFDKYHEIFRDELDPEGCYVIYCSEETCDESGEVATGLIYENFAEVYRFKLGLDEWLIWGYPMNTGSEP